MDWVRDLPFLYRLKRYYSAQLTETSTPAVQNTGSAPEGYPLRTLQFGQWMPQRQGFRDRKYSWRSKSPSRRLRLPDSAAVDLADLLRTP